MVLPYPQQARPPTTQLFVEYDVFPLARGIGCNCFPSKSLLSLVKILGIDRSFLIFWESGYAREKFRRLRIRKRSSEQVAVVLSERRKRLEAKGKNAKCQISNAK
jgi:hypothetical protein